MRLCRDSLVIQKQFESEEKKLLELQATDGPYRYCPSLSSVASLNPVHIDARVFGSHTSLFMLMAGGRGRRFVLMLTRLLRMVAFLSDVTSK